MRVYYYCIRFNIYETENVYIYVCIMYDYY